MKPKRKDREAKENKPPRKNPIHQVSKTFMVGRANPSGYVDSDSDDDLPIFPFIQKDIKKHEEEGKTQKEKYLVVVCNRKHAELNAKRPALKAKVEAYENLSQPKIWTPPDASKNCKHLTLDQIKESSEESDDDLPIFPFIQKGIKKHEDAMKTLKDDLKNKCFVEVVDEVLQEGQDLVECNGKHAELIAKMLALKAKVEAYKNLPQPKIWTPPDTSKNYKHFTLDQIKESSEGSDDDLPIFLIQKRIKKHQDAMKKLKDDLKKKSIVEVVDEVLQEGQDLIECNGKHAELIVKMLALKEKVEAYKNIWMPPDASKNCKHLTLDQIKESSEGSDDNVPILLIQKGIKKHEDAMKKLKDDLKNKSFVELVDELLQEEKDLVECNRKYAELNAKMAALKEMIEAYENLPQPKIRTPPDASKNCKHLTLDQIKESFEKHKDLLGKIFNGEVYHRRHKAFHIPGNLRENMTAPIGLGLFEYNQLELMVDRMVQAFDPEENPDRWKYFFQVLAPELCILIFMDTYNMTREEATDYLVPHASL